MELDSVQIGAKDLAAAVRSYSLLLECRPQPSADGTFRFQLAQGAIELVQGADKIGSIRFRSRDEKVTRRRFVHGLEMLLSPCEATKPGVGAGRVEAIDHIVIQTADANRALALWRDEMGLRLALDREFAPRGLRLLFFRSAGITLEVASAIPAAASAADDSYQGVAYRVNDLVGFREHLASNGFDVSEIRPGFKAGTTVVTVRSGTAGVATLLLQDPNRQAVR